MASGLNPLLALRDCGQSVWLDHISRGLLTARTLDRFTSSFHRLIDTVGRKRRALLTTTS